MNLVRLTSISKNTIPDYKIRLKNSENAILGACSNKIHIYSESQVKET